MSNKQKAKIINLETGEQVSVQFNPNEYSFRKRNSWKEKPIKGKEVPQLEFGGGKPASLKMKLFFDTTETGEDVRRYTTLIWNLMRITTTNPETDKGEPPKCKFAWGSMWQFTAVVKSINQKFQMFLGDGTPVRSELQVTFQQVQSENEFGPQNPTTRTDARRTRVVRAGDRLDLIAYQEYGDANHWMFLAQVNDIEDPTTLVPGQVLKIVSLP